MTKEQILEKMKIDLETRGRCADTVRTYCMHVRLYQEHYDKPADTLRLDSPLLESPPKVPFCLSSLPVDRTPPILSNPHGYAATLLINTFWLVLPCFHVVLGNCELFSPSRDV